MLATFWVALFRNEEKAELKQVIQTLEQKEIALKNDLKADYERILPPNAVKPLALAIVIPAL
ncbi:hypothetical protein HpNP104_00190 [Helicobacter pylori]|nr:hypothetical protein KVD94_07525 [Helicobacter pylori]WRC72893.1 hypothetical protein E5K94_07315 [Helicobacter pylori]